MGRAWYPIDMIALDRAMQTGNFRDFTGPLPAQLKKSRESALKMIETLKLEPTKTFIGGFSQGAILSVDVALNAPSQFAGVLIFSGVMMGTVIM